MVFPANVSAEAAGRGDAYIMAGCEIPSPTEVYEASLHKRGLTINSQLTAFLSFSPHRKTEKYQNRNKQVAEQHTPPSRALHDHLEDF